MFGVKKEATAPQAPSTTDVDDLLGDGTTIVMWRGKYPVKVRAMSGELERKAQSIMKPQYRGHQRTEDKVDPIALRDFYCREVVVDVDGLTRQDQPYGKTPEDRQELWDKTPDFRVFVIAAASDAANFEQEKKV